MARFDLLQELGRPCSMYVPSGPSSAGPVRLRSRPLSAFDAKQCSRPPYLRGFQLSGLKLLQMYSVPTAAPHGATSGMSA